MMMLLLSSVSASALFRETTFLPTDNPNCIGWFRLNNVNEHTLSGASVISVLNKIVTTPVLTLDSGTGDVTYDGSVPFTNTAKAVEFNETGQLILSGLPATKLNIFVGAQRRGNGGSQVLLGASNTYLPIADFNATTNITRWDGADDQSGLRYLGGFETLPPTTRTEAINTMIDHFAHSFVGIDNTVAALTSIGLGRQGSGWGFQGVMSQLIVVEGDMTALEIFEMQRYLGISDGWLNGFRSLDLGIDDLGNIADKSGYGQLLTLNGGISSAAKAEYPDGSIYFDGVDDWIEIENDVLLQMAFPIFSFDIDLIFDETPSTRTWICGFANGNGAFSWSFWVENGEIRYSTWSSPSGEGEVRINTGISPVAGDRIKCRVTRDGTTQRCVINDVEVDARNLPSSSFFPAGNFSVGQRGASYDNYFKGWIGKLQLTYGETFTLQAPSTEYMPSGAWTWFNHSRGIVVGGSDVVGAVTPTGIIQVHDLDNETLHDLRPSLFTADDHVNPSVLRLDNGTIMAMASSRNGSGMYQYLSTAVDDPSEFDTETNIDAQLGLDVYAYTQIHQLEAETNDPVYLFFRSRDGGTAHNYFSKADSTSGWETFSSATRFMDNSGDSATWSPYFISKKKNDSRIDFVCTDGHPVAVSDNSIYHFYFEGGTFYATDGTALTLPIDPQTDLTKVYDGTTARSWIWDLTWDASGNPAVLYARYPSGGTDHVMARATYDGTSWTNEDIITTGDGLYAAEPYYAGGGCFAENNPDKAYISVEDTSGIYQVNEVTKSGTWTAVAKTDNSDNSLRPFIPIGSSNVVYFSGRYSAFDDFDTRIMRFAQ